MCFGWELLICDIGLGARKSRISVWKRFHDGLWLRSYVFVCLFFLFYQWMSSHLSYPTQLNHIHALLHLATNSYGTNTTKIHPRFQIPALSDDANKSQRQQLGALFGEKDTSLGCIGGDSQVRWIGIYKMGPQTTLGFHNSTFIRVIFAQGKPCVFFGHQLKKGPHNSIYN